MPYIIPEELREIDPNSQLETLGGGFAFPARITESGATKVTIGEENVKSNIFFIAANSRKELYGTASFGGDVYPMLFMPLGTANVTAHSDWLQESIEIWETRAKDVRVSAGKSTKSDTKVTMLVQYLVEATGNYNNLNISEVI